MSRRKERKRDEATFNAALDTILASALEDIRLHHDAWVERVFGKSACNSTEALPDPSDRKAV